VYLMDVMSEYSCIQNEWDHDPNQNIFHDNIIHEIVRPEVGETQEINCKHLEAYRYKLSLRKQESHPLPKCPDVYYTFHINLIDVCRFVIAKYEEKVLYTFQEEKEEHVFDLNNNHLHYHYIVLILTVDNNADEKFFVAACQNVANCDNDNNNYKNKLEFKEKEKYEKDLQAIIKIEETTTIPKM